MSQQSFFLIYQLFHLLNKPGFYLGNIMNFFYGSSFAQSFVHDKMTFTGRSD